MIRVLRGLFIAQELHPNFARDSSIGMFFAYCMFLYDSNGARAVTMAVD
jgi:hypothetical protein